MGRVVIGALLFGLLLHATTFGADWTVGPRPSWVEVRDRSAVPLPAPGTLEGGAYDLLIETQVNLETGETSRRSAFQIANESGIQNNASIQITFDPAYQFLTFHEVRVVRDGSVVEKFDPTRVRLLDREENLERHLLDGHLTFYFPLEDIRVGDVVDYSYTIRGFQPAFQGKYHTNFVLQWTSPVARQMFRILGSGDRKLNLHASGGAPEAERRSLPDGLFEWRWESTDIPALILEDSRPNWHNGFPTVRISESANWNAVARWAAGLYDLGSPLGPAETAAVQSIAAASSNEADRIASALRFVQDRVRYLGIEMGAGSYQPSAGETVLNRGFGDCKDKTQLLVRLLRAMNIAADPVLVHSGWTRGIADFPPTPLAFDHVICRVAMASGKTYWLDPTLPGQTGPLAERHAGNYGLGLVVAPATEALAVIPDATGSDLAEITESFMVGASGEPAELRVHSVFHGKRADAERDAFQETSIERIGRNFRDFYAAQYPDIEQIEPVRFTDFPAENRVETHEVYRIPDLWRPGKDGRFRASFSPQILRNELSRPDSVRRRAPYWIPHPRKTIQNIEIDFGKPWDMSFADDQEDNPHFRFTHTGTKDGNTIRLRYEYESRKDHVPAADIPTYRATVDRIRDNLGWTFTSGSEKESPWELNWLALLPVVAGLGTGLAVTIFLTFSRKVPPPLPQPGDADRVGLGGWLVLAQVGLWSRPITLLIGLKDFTALVTLADWQKLTQPGGDSYHPRAGLALVFEAYCIIFLIVLSIAAIVFFYQRRWIAPRLIAGILALGLIYNIADYLLCLGIPWVDHSGSEIVRMAFASAIWIPYFLISRRVRATFTRP